MSVISCLKCNKTRVIAFGEGLSKGWPTCCGETMRLGAVTKKEIEQGVAHAMRPLAALRRALKGSP